jgi:hypothetical protein
VADRTLRRKLKLKPIMERQVSIMNEPIIVYGEGFISKKVGSQTSTIWIQPFQLDEEWVQEWIKRPY